MNFEEVLDDLNTEVISVVRNKVSRYLVNINY